MERVGQMHKKKKRKYFQRSFVSTSDKTYGVRTQSKRAF